MEQLNFAATKNTPAIRIDKPGGLFKISGRSLPEDAITFYKPVFDWLELFSTTPSEKLSIEFELEYFNTPSSKIILDILMRVEEIHYNGVCAVSVNWLYEHDDEDMMDAGREYKDLVKIPFFLNAN